MASAASDGGVEIVEFVWPIPDKGLNKCIHRIQAPTLVVWGRHDRLIPPVYAEEFVGRIRGARVEMIEEAGHVLTMATT
jgi:pimeloyl-ACP methyl ester carboxylesterase